MPPGIPREGQSHPCAVLCCPTVSSCPREGPSPCAILSSPDGAGGILGAGSTVHSKAAASGGGSGVAGVKSGGALP